MKLTKILLGMFLFAASCSQQGTENQSKPTDNQPQMATQENSRFTTDMVVNTKDYACGMPTSAGISDTSHYEGKVYGFCSVECKAEFQKDPVKYLASNQ
jgi:YHS domain-containing protein